VDGKSRFAQLREGQWKMKWFRGLLSQEKSWGKLKNQDKLKRCEKNVN